MSTLLAQLQEVARRRDLDEKIGAFLRARYEFTKDPQHRVRRQDVYLAVAKETGETDNNELRCRVADLAEAFGAREIKPYNQRLFCRMRAKDATLLPAPGPTGQRAVAALQRAWYARLDAEGMGVSADGAPKRGFTYRQYRAEMNTHAFEKMVDHYWAMRRDLEAWGLYALEGLSIMDVATRTGQTFAAVTDVVTRMKAQIEPLRTLDRDAAKLHDEGMTMPAIAAKLGVKRNVVERALKRLASTREARVRLSDPVHETGQQED